MMAVLFDKQKSLALNGVDLSRKGSIDEEIVPLVQHINNHVNFFTTSSCSGRIIVFDDHIDEERPGLKVKKKGCKWLFTSHKAADAEQVIESLKDLNGDAVFKFEPFVLHVQCRNTEYAQRTLCCAVASGFRNSGISLGNKGKIIVGVRSTHGLEAPLSKDGNLLVSMEFIKFLTKSANKKLEENFLRIQKFFESMKKIDFMENKLARRERKRKDKKSFGDNEVESVRGVKGGTRGDLDLHVRQYSPGKIGVTSVGTAKDNIARGSCEAVDGSDEDSSSGTPVNEDTSTSIGSDVLDEERFSQGGQTSPPRECQDKEDRTTGRKTSPYQKNMDKKDRTTDGQASPSPECQDKEDRTTIDIEKCFLSKDVT
ncbi:tRNA wybutosine-synthesizing protein 3 homolog [Mizuhopecten yessoensis]|uniref:tRNA wybutosine-synthesizing protein 3 homolog n=1 Tax=Mizuhopecten yessoensis TaxID=6573 RepID=A0A210QWX7_MIZYE|nr:tRNA wybutosine-synthesizing protein 3 homolog [Mizuhopecten yessoensis]OWF53247.1 tRNA wybutosine-synthesizing protein 3-like [Mizuhopecten yessoensis]